MTRAIERIPLSRIRVSDRLRAIDPAYVEMLKSSILANRTMGHSGLLNPVEVRPVEGGFQLVAGGHRFGAIEAIGDDAIDAVVVHLDEFQARLREIDENLVRRELSALDRACFLAERKHVWECLYPETARGKKGALVRWYDANDTMSFASEAAEKAGLSMRTVQRDIKLWLGLSADSRTRLRGTRLADDQGQLKALSKLGPDRQCQVLDALQREEDPARNVADALAEVDGTRKIVPSPEEKSFAALVSAWTHAPAKARGRFLDHLYSSGALQAYLNEPAEDEEAA